LLRSLRGDPAAQVRAMTVAILIVGGLATYTGWRGYQLSQAIQGERAHNILASCLQANERHDRAITVFDAQIARLSAEQRANARASREFTVALIEALSPKRDCRALVSRQVDAK
jgi:hypothetical protein